MTSSRLWLIVVAVLLAGCAGSAPSLRNEQPVVMTGEEACRDPTALILLCGKRACAFYRCREVALLGNAPREAAPNDARDEGASARTAAPGKVVLAQGFVAEAPLEMEYDVEPLPSDSLIGPGHTGPVFVIPWGQTTSPYPLPPGLREYAEQLSRLPHIEHHIFPQGEQFRAWLTSRGIDPEEWTVPVVADDYFRIHEGPQGDLWDAAWRELMRARPHATAREIRKYSGELSLRFGIIEPISAGLGPMVPRRVAAEETVKSVGIDPAVKARVDKALAECAALASQEVLARQFNGRIPTPRDCREQVGWDAKGNPITRAQELGIEMHKVALACAREKLGKLRPGGFGIEPRYRYDPRTGRATSMNPEEEKALLSQGRMSELLGTIVPDIVLHAGNPAWVQLVYDFKFPCVDPEADPKWRPYPYGHPYEKESQKDIYEKALGAEPAPVTPRRGVIR